MHESSLARQILRAVLKAADGGTVTAVNGWLSESESLSAESLQFHFSALARDTPAAAARLNLRLEHIQARCDGCGALYLPEHHLTLCPDCGSTEGELLGESGMGIDTIEVT